MMPFTPEQEARIREIVREELSRRTADRSRRVIPPSVTEEFVNQLQASGGLPKKSPGRS
jgi:hypothetical protein